MRPDYDCVVIGAGLAGAALAIGLGKLGLRTAVVDARAAPAADAAAADVRGLALAPSSRRILESLAVWDGLQPAIIPIKHIHVSDRGHFGGTRLSHSDVGLPALGYVCPADRLQGTLERQLTADPHCDIFWSTRVLAVASADSAVQIALERDALRLEMSAGLLIGADGIHSRMRECSRIETTIRDYGQTAIVANVNAARPLAHTAFERFTATGPCALLPLGGARYVAVRTARECETGALLAMSDAEYLADLQARFGLRLGTFSALSPRTAHPLVLSRARTLTAERTVLIGNAANTVHPNAAQGLNLGLRDCAVLIDCVAAAQRRGDDIGGPGVLGAYRERRARDHRRIVGISHGLAEVFASGWAPLVLARGAAMLACDLLPPLKRTLIQRLSGLSELVQSRAPEGLV